MAPATEPNSAVGKPSATAAEGPKFSLERLSSAFARLMGAPPASARVGAPAPQVAIADDSIVEDDALPVTPPMIVEGMLFVGDAENRPLTARHIASHIRDVTPEEVEQIIAQLNEGYRQDGAAYEIVAQAGGYQLRLRPDLDRLRARFRGRVRAARLTPQALEVLAIVAYRQGVTVDELNRLRGTASYPILSQLVRRQLVRVERSSESARTARYYTTGRFNQVFGLSSVAELPRGEEVVDS
ncbi:MAG: SMC-Scp complex subunit ScpB [Pirellulales bacterium]|nr:SMC-Scp complex subunit ScpB [Pirellulales bacterium]